MIKLKNYNQYLILEKYEKSLRDKLIEMGITDEKELEKQISLAKSGHLGSYLQDKGDIFTFGILNAIFKDAIYAKKKTKLKKDIVSILPRAIPLSLVYFFPITAVIGTFLGSSRLAHKIFDTIFNYLNPQSKYSDFLKRTVDVYMKIPEGEVNLKDRFSRAFVVSDRIIDAIKPEVIDNFTTFISNKMESEDESKKVPDNYIENELKKYLNDKFDITPEIPLKK